MPAKHPHTHTHTYISSGIVMVYRMAISQNGHAGFQPILRVALYTRLYSTNAAPPDNTWTADMKENKAPTTQYIHIQSLIRTYIVPVQ